MHESFMQWEVGSVIFGDEHTRRITYVLITKATIWYVKSHGHIYLGDPNGYSHHKCINGHNTTRLRIMLACLL